MRCRILLQNTKKRISNFFNKCVNKEYVNEIEESSEIFQLANTLANYDEIKEILMNSFQIALVDSNDLIRSVKITQIKEKTYEKFEKALFEAFLNPDFSREYRVFLIPFYEKSTDRWWKIIEVA